MHPGACGFEAPVCSWPQALGVVRAASSHRQNPCLPFEGWAIAYDATALQQMHPRAENPPAIPTLGVFGALGLVLLSAGLLPLSYGRSMPLRMVNHRIHILALTRTARIHASYHIPNPHPHSKSKHKQCDRIRTVLETMDSSVKPVVVNLQVRATGRARADAQLFRRVHTLAHGYLANQGTFMTPNSGGSCITLSILSTHKQASKKQD